MYRWINKLFAHLNQKSQVLIQTPNRGSFGNGAEEMFFGLLKAQRENKKVLFLYPRLKLFGWGLSMANRELFHLRSNYLISNETVYGFLGGCLLSFYVLFLWIIDWFRHTQMLRSLVRLVWPKISKKAEKNHGYVVPQIGRSEIWKPVGVKSFLWDVICKQNWKQQYANYLPPKLAEDKYRHAEQIRLKMGIPLSDWFVCLHVSESNPPTVRNASIHNYVEGIKAITAAGGWVVRLGEPSMTPLPTMERVIDYGQTSYKSDLIDLYFISECRFFIGLGSGPTFVASLFDKPQVLVNMNDWSMGVPLKKGSLVLIKHVFSRSRNCFLSVKEILGESYEVTVFDEPIDDYLLFENTSEEIRDVIEEFLTSSENFEYSSLQKDFNETRKTAIRRWIQEGEPRWDGVPAREIFIGQHRIASRLDAAGTIGRKYLKQNWFM